MEIYINNEQDIYEIDQTIEKMINDLTYLVLESENISDEGELSILFTTDEGIHKINKEFRDIDKKTDVLSFPQYPSLKDGCDDIYIVLGDIIISTETALEQAKEYNHSTHRELGFLFVHSMFHLLGYDHDTEENTKIMRAKEEGILKKYNLTR